MYFILAQTTALLHFLGLAYMVFGGFLAWRWPRAILPHVPCAAWGLLVVLDINPQHPLTWLEDWFRVAHGLDPLPDGFNDHYLYGVLIPYSLIPHVAVLAAAVVVFSYAGAVVSWRRTAPFADA